MTTHAAPPDFYADLTERNRGFVSDRAQSELGRSRLLIAGCGSTGGAAVEPLVRLGAQDFVLADNGTFELNNLNRQHAVFTDIGSNKATVAAGRVTAINPYARAEVVTEGITEKNVERLVAGCSLVVDGVDVTERAGWRAKYLLHAAAARERLPVLTGYDMAGTQYIRFYDYRRAGSRPFDGKITEAMTEQAMVWSLLFKVIPVRHIPLEMLVNAREHLADTEYSVPQLVYASLLFGALSARMTAEILAGEPVRRNVAVDVHRATRRRAGRWAAAAQRPLVLLGGLRELAARKRAYAPLPAAPVPEEGSTG
ncbi:ThiF family adenylyltransferase [Streptomyces sp. SID10853]|uniref:ThiF family adenylyltransferase n=1 Tax=Streptomyces sp. SID10853 TaxID=2706028 RepID=UPI0013C1CD14|nr:ThiF family adenylyltransferase [Streptomyces sp. SID10853]NDZ80943.1 ThiF family adenylyltransferase [Streptomyces sp. SID10853]